MMKKIHYLYVSVCLLLAVCFGVTYGMLFILGLYVTVLLIYKMLWGQANTNPQWPRTKCLVGKTLLAGLLLYYFSFAFLAVQIFTEARSTYVAEQACDYVVVLGAAVKGDTLSVSARNRLDTAYVYLEQHPHIKVIVSGGQGRGENVSEASAMGDYLLARGIAPARILYENQSTTTVENISFSKKIAEADMPGQQPHVLIVTSDYHMLRAKLICQRLGVDYAGLSSHSSPALAINYSIREYFAMLKFLAMEYKA